jgi:hypothetical protein
MKVKLRFEEAVIFGRLILRRLHTAAARRCGEGVGANVGWREILATGTRRLR